MQIVAASLVPLAAPKLGFKNPAEVNSEVLAYIGMMAIALLVFRLICAPYFIWKEDQSQIADLNHELGRPERLEREHTATLLADDRRLALELLANMHFYWFTVAAAGRSAVEDLRISVEDGSHKLAMLILAHGDDLDRHSCFRDFGGVCAEIEGGRRGAECADLLTDAYIKASASIKGRPKP